MKIETSGFIQQSGPWIPCLKPGEKNYTFSPEELSELLHKAFSDGYQFAKDIYATPEIKTTVASSIIAGETNHGQN